MSRRILRTVFSSDRQKKPRGTSLYTEDGIRVRRLYVKLLNSKRTERPFDKVQLTKIFSKFGEVEEVVVYYKISFSFAFVTMKKYEDAATILYRSLLKPYGYRVSKADSWHQPKDIDQTEASTSGTGDPESKVENVKKVKTEPTTISNLNEDCLAAIFKYLNLLELSRMEEVYPQYKHMFHSLYKYNYRKIDFKNLKNKELTLMELRGILKYSGQYANELKVKSKYITGRNNRIVLMIPKYCPDLTVLELNGLFLQKRLLLPFKSLMGKLTKLTLAYNIIDDATLFFLFSWLTTNLKTLKICCNDCVRGQFLSKVHNLENLCLKSCYNIQARPFVEFCKFNTTLKYLHIGHCPDLNDACFTAIAQNLCNLQFLVISSFYSSRRVTNYRMFYEIETLTRLRICFEEYVPNENLYKALAAVNRLEYLDINTCEINKEEQESILKMTNLKHINISQIQLFDDETLCLLAYRNKKLNALYACSCWGITEDGIANFVGMSKHCELLNVSHNIGITKTLIPLVINALNRTRNCKDPKLNLIVKDTSIVPDDLDLECYINQSKLIIIFDQKKAELVSPYEMVEHEGYYKIPRLVKEVEVDDGLDYDDDSDFYDSDFFDSDNNSEIDYDMFDINDVFGYEFNELFGEERFVPSDLDE